MGQQPFQCERPRRRPTLEGREERASSRGTGRHLLGSPRAVLSPAGSPPLRDGYRERPSGDRHSPDVCRTLALGVNSVYYLHQTPLS